MTDLNKQELLAMVQALQVQHADLVLRNKILRERPDLPVDRIRCHDRVVGLQAERDRLIFELSMAKKALRRAAAHDCGGLGCCQLCADEKAGEVGNG